MVSMVFELLLYTFASAILAHYPFEHWMPEIKRTYKVFDII